MKLVSFEHEGTTTIGLVVAGNGVIELGSRLGCKDLRTLLAEDRVAEVGWLAGEAPDFDLAELVLLPVIPNPDKIICVGVNYASHVRETGREMPEYPVLFPRFASSQVGHGQPIVRPPESGQLDFEGELAVIIGKAGRRIQRAEAFDHIGGYACFNDATIRDFQRHSSQFMPGKNFAGCGAFGPWLVTPDEVPDPSALTLETRLNGRVMQHAPVSDLIFDIPALIQYISTFTRLLPGDVIVTGTTGGVGAFRTPPVWMRSGDVVEVEIQGVGILSNEIVDEAIA